MPKRRSAYNKENLEPNFDADEINRASKRQRPISCRNTLQVDDSTAPILSVKLPTKTSNKLQSKAKVEFKDDETDSSDYENYKQICSKRDKLKKPKSKAAVQPYDSSDIDTDDSTTDDDEDIDSSASSEYEKKIFKPMAKKFNNLSKASNKNSATAPTSSAAIASTSAAASNTAITFTSQTHYKDGRILFPYQLEAVSEMINIETGTFYSDIQFYAGRLRLAPGSGKTAIVLELIKQMPSMDRQRHLQDKIDLSVAIRFIPEPPLLPINLIIVPHSLYFQWKYEIERITNLKFIFMDKCQKLSKMSPNSTPVNILIRNTLLTKFVSMNNFGDDLNPKVTLMRVFVDEYDSIRDLAHVPFSRFVWLVSATHEFSKSKRTYISRHDGHTLNLNLVTYSETRVWNEQRASNVLPQDFRALKHFYRPHVLCKVFGDELLSFGEMLQLNAGDTSLDAKRLVQQILERIEVKVRVAKRALDEYEGGVLERISDLKEKLENHKAELKRINDNLADATCNICLELTNQVIIAACCQKIFCGSCLDECRKTNPLCPCCRTSLEKTIATYKEFATAKARNQNPSEELPSNASDLLRTLVDRIVAENSEAKILVFSINEEKLSFLSDNKSVKLGFVRGTAAAISKVIEAYKTTNIDKDSFNMLVLNAWYTVAGLNLENTTDIIFFHEINDARMLQAVGRANRPGRNLSLILNVHHILPKEE